MRNFVLIHAILETAAGIGLYVMPQLFFTPGEVVPDALIIIKMYGILAAFYGIASGIVWKTVSDHDKIRLYLLAAMGFHMIIGFYLYGLASSGYLEKPYGCYTHLIIFAILTFGYLKYRFPQQ